MTQFRVKASFADKHQRAHLGYNRPEVLPGTKIYCIQHKSSGSYFNYAYLEASDANKVCDKMNAGTDSTLTNSMVFWNFSHAPRYIVKSIRAGGNF